MLGLSTTGIRVYTRGLAGRPRYPNTYIAYRYQVQGKLVTYMQNPFLIFERACKSYVHMIISPIQVHYLCITCAELEVEIDTVKHVGQLHTRQVHFNSSYKEAKSST